MNIAMSTIDVSYAHLGNICKLAIYTGYTFPIQAYLILLYFDLLHFAYIAFYNKLKVCGNPAWSKAIGAIFLTALHYFF